MVCKIACDLRSKSFQGYFLLTVNWLHCLSKAPEGLMSILVEVNDQVSFDSHVAHTILCVYIETSLTVLQIPTMDLIY